MVKPSGKAIQRLGIKDSRKFIHSLPSRICSQSRKSEPCPRLRAWAPSSLRNSSCWVWKQAKRWDMKEMAASTLETPLHKVAPSLGTRKDIFRGFSRQEDCSSHNLTGRDILDIKATAVNLVGALTYRTRCAICALGGGGEGDPCGCPYN